LFTLTKKNNLLILFGILLLSACNLTSSGDPTDNPEAVYTSAAQTVAVQLTQNAGSRPSATSTQLANLSQTPLTTLPVNITPTLTSPTSQTTTSISTSTATFIPVADKAQFISQVPGDGVVVAPNQSITVVWTVQNIGQTTWNTSYQIRFFSGSRLGDGLPGSYSFTAQVKPNENIQLSAQLIAPSQVGEYTSNWVVTNDQGMNFYSIFITIKVGLPTTTSTPTITQTPTITITPSATPTETSTPS
jgi:hypothetical protein